VTIRILLVIRSANPQIRILPETEEYWHPISYRFGVIAAYCSNV